MKRIIALLLITTIALSYSVTTFNDSTTSRYIDLLNYGFSNMSFLTYLPKNTTVSTAQFNLAGLKNYDNFTLYQDSANPTDNFNDVNIYNTTLGYATSTNNFYKYEGETWVVNQTSYSLKKFDLIESGTRAFATNNSNKIYYYNGATWGINQTVAGIEFNLTDIDMANNTFGMAVGYNSTDTIVYKYENGLWSLNLSASIATNIFYGIKFVNKTYAIVVGYASMGGYWRYINGEWGENIMISGYGKNSRAIDGPCSYKNMMAIVGKSGDICRWTSDEGFDCTEDVPVLTDYSDVTYISQDYDLSMSSYNNYKNRDTVYLGNKISLADPDVCVFYAISENNIIKRTVSTGWKNWSQELTVNSFRTISGQEDNLDSKIFAMGDKLTIAEQPGYVGNISMGINGITGDWNMTGVRLIQQNATLKNAINDYMPTCTPINSNCSIYLNVSVLEISGGYLNITSFNITYGTMLAGAEYSGLNFTFLNGTEVTSNAVYNDTYVYIRSNGVVSAKVRTRFSNQPNYSGFNMTAGVDATDKRAYVNSTPLSAANLSMNLSGKTMYLNRSNTSCSKVCKIDDDVSTATLEAIVTEAQCTSAGGTVATPVTETINNQIYFVITGMTNSGIVQINSTGNSPPVLASPSVSPTTGNQDTVFTFSVTVYDGDNDKMDSVYLNIDETNYNMTETSHADQTTSDGKAFTQTAVLSGGSTHSYYFTATDNASQTGTTSTMYLYISHVSEIPTVSSSPGMNALMVVFVFLTAYCIVLIKNHSSDSYS